MVLIRNVLKMFKMCYRNVKGPKTKPCGNFCQIDENHSKADPNTPTQYLNLSTIAWSLTGDTFQWIKL